MRRLALAVVALAAALTLAGTASAAPYTVSACTTANPANRLFTPVGSSTSTCGTSLAADQAAQAAVLENSAWILFPPRATTVSSFDVTASAQWSGSGIWGSTIDALGGTCLAGPTVPGWPCGWLPGPSGTSPSTRYQRSGLSLPALRLVSWCIQSTGCPSGRVHSEWKDVTVTLDDPEPPAIANPTGLWAAGSTWVRGSQPLAFDASDNTGVKRNKVDVDARNVADQTYACDYGKAAPCSDHSWSGQVDTTTLADGPHTLHLAAQDAADTWASPADRSFNADNHAPDAPAIAVDGGEGMRSTPSWTLRWTDPPGQFAPITATDYRVCRADGTSCSTGRAAPGASPLSGSFGITQPGDYTLRLWLEDAAGNADPAHPSNEVHLRFDNGQPGQAAPSPAPERWIGGADTLTFTEPIAMAPGAAVPLSGIAGYAVTVDGSTPGSTPNVTAGAAGNASFGPPPGGWPEGPVTVKARAISGTGIASLDAGQATLHFDRSAPTTRAYGQGSPTDWQPGPVTVTLTASDALSGMGAADDDRPVEDGGHIVYSLDGGTTRKARGDEVDVPVAGNGRHALTFRAYDAAGNGSADRNLVVNVGEPSEALGAPGPGFSARSLGGTTVFSAARTFASPCPERATLKAARDTYVDQSHPAQPNDASTSLAVRSAAGANARSLVGFTLAPATGCHVVSAELRLYDASQTAGRTLQAYRLGSSWDADATWDTRPGVAGTAATAGSGPGWLSFDVTRQIEAIYRYGDNGLVIRDRDESVSPGATQSLDSREGAHPPELIVSFG
jgi:hypothetical protein